MEVVNILDAFGYKWAQTGTVEALTDDQWKVGWAFIGAVPPSVEQFNKWGQIFDEKSNYLYSQMKTVYDLAGVVPGAGDANSLRDAIRTLFSPGRLINVRIFAATSVYTPTAGTNRIRVRAVGGGGAGGGGAINNATTICSGSGGAMGSCAEAIYSSGFAGLTVTIGAAGVGVAGTAGGPGGTTSVGGLLSCPGGGGGQATQTSTSTSAAIVGQGGPGAVPTGTGIIFATAGQPGPSGINFGTASLPFGGQGAPSPFGGGGQNTNTGAGSPASGYGAGGGGAATLINAAAAVPGGAGSPGLVIIEEFA